GGVGGGAPCSSVVQRSTPNGRGARAFPCPRRSGVVSSRLEKEPGMPQVRVGDVELYYELVDCTEPWHSGPPPIVLLHGLGTDRRIWLYQVPELCGRVPTILVDLRGHARASAPDGEWSVADMAHDVVRLLRHLGAERVH